MAGGAAACAEAATGAATTTAAAIATFLGVTNVKRARSMCLLNGVPIDVGRRLAGLPCARSDVVALLDWKDEDAAVTDLAGPRSRHDGLDHVFDDVVGDDNLDFNLRQQADAVFLAAIDRGVTFLAPVTAYVRDGHAGDAEFLERLA